ncbi:hypothetical protein JVU11DRAFT_2093 [Chiua virens]|nr:hypothetical protein JVU11DRAFT_2093 [Chiua virens]
MLRNSGCAWFCPRKPNKCKWNGYKKPRWSTRTHLIIFFLSKTALPTALPDRLYCTTKFNLSLERPTSIMGHSSSQPQRSDSQYHVSGVGDSRNGVEKHRSADAGKAWSSDVAAPPPYTSTAPEMQLNGGQQTWPSSTLAGSSSSSPPFASHERVKDIAYLQAPMRRESEENALEMLRKYDTVIIMDDSASMLQDHRWEQACNALSELADTAGAYDRDGIDIHFLNHRRAGVNMRDAAAVRQLFMHVRPHGLTPIAYKLDLLVGDYIEKLEKASRKKKKGDPTILNRIKPVNFIVITDGVPTDEPLDSIVALARRLDRGNYPLAQVGIQFVQIGDDRDATAFLKQLDDDLSGSFGVRDIVDTTPYLGIHLTSVMLLKILLGGINRRVDRRGGEALINV